MVSLSGVADHYRSNTTTALSVEGPEVTVTCKDAQHRKRCVVRRECSIALCLTDDSHLDCGNTLQGDHPHFVLD